jgi:hypothetical protein
MKSKNAFFVIGTIGMITTAVLHIVLAMLVPSPSVHTTFGVMYPVFFSFLMLGAARFMKQKPAPVPVRVRK